MGRVARVGNTEKHVEFWCRNLKEGDNLEDLGLEGDIIKMVIKEIRQAVCTDLIWRTFVNTVMKYRA
jgi:hypothetical protein